MIWEITDGNPGGVGLVNFVLNMLKDGLNVGWGCVGGHGRTGWLAARIYKEVMQCSGDEAVTWIRDHYCDDAVESLSQIQDLGCVECQPARVTTVYYGKDWWKKGGK